MSYNDEEEQRRSSRVVVETPHARREVYQSQTTRVPDRGGYSTGTVVAVALTAIAATAVIFLFMMTRGDEETSVNVNAQTAAQSTPLVIQMTPLPTPFPTPPPMTQTAPVIITPPIDSSIPPVTTTAPPAPAPTPNVPDDGTIQNGVSTKIQDDAALASTDVLATVSRGKVTLTGTVKSQDLKRRAERLAFSVKGVRVVENQITVLSTPDANATP